MLSTEKTGHSVLQVSPLASGARGTVSIAPRLFAFPRESPSIFARCCLSARRVFACRLLASLTVRPCVRWPRRTISPPHRRGRGSCRAPARTRPPSCGKQQRVRKAASDAQRVSRCHGTYYLQLESAQVRRRQFLVRLLCHYSAIRLTSAITPVLSGLTTHERSARPAPNV